jgi:phospholipid/cholesterol/gamma-HCH transport system ATP-binding protein
MKQDPAIVVRHLSVGYGGREVLRDVSFEVRRGEIFMILGGSGSGKSTLLKTMIGLCPPLSGEILIDGRPAPRAGAF